LLQNISHQVINIILLAIFIAPNARAIYKYSPAFQFEIFLLYAAIVSAFIFVSQTQSFKRYFEKYFANYFYIILIIVAASIIIWFVYPVADGLKLQLRGSDQDDCVIIGASSLLHFNHPYLERSYFGNPCSPGMGMLLMYVPFVFFKIYEYGAIVAAILTIFFIKKKTLSVFQMSVFASLIFGSLFQLEMLVVGSDLFVIGFALTIVSITICEAVSNKSIKALIWIAILVGLISSSRINFLVLFPVISFYLYLHSKKMAFVFFAISSCIAIIPSAYIYLLNPADFTPLHLLGKGRNLLPGGFMEIGIMMSVAAFFVGAYLVNKSVNHMPFAILLSISPMLLFVSFGDLIVRDYKFQFWEGANYLLPIIPLLVFVLISRLQHRN